MSYFLAARLIAESTTRRGNFILQRIGSILSLRTSCISEQMSAFIEHLKYADCTLIYLCAASFIEVFATF